MSAKRRRALALMERLRGLDIDEVSREMADARSQMEKLTASRTELREKLETERNVTSPEALPYVSSFVEAVTRQIRRIDAKIADLEPVMAKFEDQMRELYREQKVYESVRLRDLRNEQIAAEKRETAEMEELTLLRWNR